MVQNHNGPFIGIIVTKLHCTDEIIYFQNSYDSFELTFSHFFLVICSSTLPSVQDLPSLYDKNMRRISLNPFIDKNSTTIHSKRRASYGTYTVKIFNPSILPYMMMMHHKHSQFSGLKSFISVSHVIYI